VTATLWPVPDGRRRISWFAFNRRMKSGLDKSAALRSAKRRMIRRGRPHPFYWAGYVLFGDPDGTIRFFLSARAFYKTE
jgi:CHAT domain-containing protein